MIERHTLIRRILCATLLGALAPLVAGCGSGTGPEAPVDAPTLHTAVGEEEIGLAPPSEGSLSVRAGVFLSVRGAADPDAVSEARAAEWIREVVRGANEIFAPCGLHVALEAAQVVRMPDRLLSIAGNRKGSWGGHPPDSVSDPDLFMYNENERLTDETRELFAYGRRYLSRNAIAVFTVQTIEYYIGDSRTGAGGLSFPPVVYHHDDDYPLRNSVLLASAHPVGRLPDRVGGRTLAHEFGHMLLNTGTHAEDPSNLMASGASVTAEQCARMRENRERLYGGEAVPDPGSPPSWRGSFIGGDRLRPASSSSAAPFRSPWTGGTETTKAALSRGFRSFRLTSL